MLLDPDIVTIECLTNFLAIHFLFTKQWQFFKLLLFVLSCFWCIMHNGIVWLPYVWNNFMGIGIFLELSAIGLQVRIFKFLVCSGAPSGGREIPNCNFSKTCLFRIDAKESRSIHDHSKAMRICWKRILQNWTRMSHNILVIHWNQGSKLGFSSFPGNSNPIHVHTNVQFCTDKVRKQ